jgi:hypothetical protein
MEVNNDVVSDILPAIKQENSESSDINFFNKKLKSNNEKITD